MRMTSRKKEILSYFEPDSLEWGIGAPPFDVSGGTYLLHGMVRSISAAISSQPGARWKLVTA